MSNKCRKCGGQIENPDGKKQVCGECGNMKDKLREELFDAIKDDDMPPQFYEDMVEFRLLPAIQRHIDAEYVKISSLPTVDEIYQTCICTLNNKWCPGNYYEQQKTKNAYLDIFFKIAKALHTRINQKEK